MKVREKCMDRKYSTGVKLKRAASSGPYNLDRICAAGLEKS